MPQSLRPLARFLRQALLVTALLLGWLASGTAFATPSSPVARAGVLDLGTIEAASAVHPLQGEWSFDWERSSIPHPTRRCRPWRRCPASGTN